MKNFLHNILILIVVFSASQLFAAKEKNFDTAKENADEAFSELSGENSYKESQKDVQKAFTELDESMTKSTGNARPALSKSVLKGFGTGATEKAARLDALAQLSNAIVVTVSSRTEIAQSEVEGKYSQSFSEDIKTSSTTFLKGVSYTQPMKRSGEYQITAFMTAESVINTVTYLTKTLPESLEDLDPANYDGVLTKIYLAYSLLYAVTDAQIPGRQQYIDTLGKLKEQIEKLAKHGSIIFKARSDVSGKVEIDGASYELNKKIFLKPGQYDFTVKTEGFKTLSGNASIRKGDKKMVELILIPEKLGKKEVKLEIKCPVDIKTDVEKTLLDFNIVPTQNDVKQKISIEIRGNSRQVDEYARIELEIFLHTFIDGKKYKITSYKHPAFSVKRADMNARITTETRKMATAVVKKFLSSINLNEFFAE